MDHVIYQSGVIHGRTLPEPETKGACEGVCAGTVAAAADMEEIMHKEIKEPDTQRITDGPEASAEEKETETVRNDQRSLTLWLVAGAFLAYTGYQLCRGYILKEEGSALGFFVVGAGFIGFGVFLVIKATRGLAKEDKEKKNRMNKEKNKEKAEKMSISERARLAQTLENGPDEAEQTGSGAGESQTDE